MEGFEKTSVEICRMEEKHVKGAAILEKENFSRPWSENAFLEEISQDNSLYLVALDGEKVVGVCGSIRCGDEADILNVSVSKEYRRCHIAERMMERIFMENEALGIRAFILEVRRNNAPAIALYEKMGFQFLGYRKNFYEDPVEDAAIYRRDQE